MVSDRTFEPQSLKLFVLKAIVALVVILVGVGGGIFIGSTMTGQEFGSLSPEDLPNNSLFEIGEVFPNYKFTESDSDNDFEIRNFTNNKGRTLLIIVSPTCEPCHVFADFWNKKIIDKIDEDVNILLVFDSSEVETSNPDEKPLTLNRSIAVTTNRFEQSRSDRLLGTPTIVGLDSDCRIKFISSGFSPALDAEFINKNL